MKYLILIAVVVGVVWLLRSLRKPMLPPQTKPEAVQDAQEDMVSCSQCGMHLPRSEALPGRGGMFCSEGHRTAFESQRSH